MEADVKYSFSSSACGLASRLRLQEGVGRNGGVEIIKRDERWSRGSNQREKRHEETGRKINEKKPRDDRMLKMRENHAEACRDSQTAS